MNTFIRATEVWLPSPDNTLLEFGSGLYGEANTLAATSRQLCFGRGEGLPGQAWDEGRPVLLKDFDSLHFRRSAAAKAAGLSCAIALPVLVGDALRAVLVFFCGEDQAHAGAIELWHNDPRVTSDMTLVDGYYGTTPQAFESITRDTFLPRGVGLPGLAWQRGASVYMDNLAQATRFLRGVDATDVGIERGLAIPCATRSNESCVLTFLSASGSPISRRMESWVAEPSGQSLTRVFGHCEVLGALPVAKGLIDLNVAAGAIGEAYARGVPVLSAQAAREPGEVGASAAAAGLLSLVALPVVSDGVVTETVVLYF